MEFFSGSAADMLKKYGQAVPEQQPMTSLEEAQAAKANYQRLQRDAVKEAEDILAHAKDEAQRMRADGEKKLEAALARREQLAVEKIQAAEANALQEVRSQMVDLAVAATRQLIEHNLDDSARKRLVGEAIEDIPTRLQ